MNSVFRDVVRPLTEPVKSAGDEYMANHVRPDPAHMKLEQLRAQIRARHWERKIRNDALAYRGRCVRAEHGNPNPLPMFLELFSQPFKLFRRNHA